MGVYWDIIKTSHELFWNNAVFFLLYIISLVTVFFKRKKWKYGYDVLFLYSIFLSFLVIYNPIFVKIGFRLFFTDTQEYTRIFILLPVFSTIAYVITELIMKKENKERYILIIVIFLVIVLEGENIMQTQMYIKTENIYKINQASLEICEFISENENDDANIRVSITSGTNSSLEEGGSLYWGIKQYTSKIDLYDNFITLDEYKSIYENVAEEEFQNYLYVLDQTNRYKYVICENYKPMIEAMEKYGYKKIGETTGKTTESFVVLMQPYL